MSDSEQLKKDLNTEFLSTANILSDYFPGADIQII